MSAPVRPDLPELRVFSAPGCSLCDTALTALAPLATELGFAVRVVDISGDPWLEERYRERIPVGELGGHVAFKFWVDEARLRRMCAHEAGGGRA